MLCLATRQLTRLLQGKGVSNRFSKSLPQPCSNKQYSASDFVESVCVKWLSMKLAMRSD
jgi:hypothetical protein